MGRFCLESGSASWRNFPRRVALHRRIRLLKAGDDPDARFRRLHGLRYKVNMTGDSTASGKCNLADRGAAGHWTVGGVCAERCCQSEKSVRLSLCLSIEAGDLTVHLRPVLDSEFRLGLML
jgi:hypothetical protein